MWHKIEQFGQDYLLTRQIFLRLLGVIYLVAFASLCWQIEGLIGNQGILPLGEFLESAQSQLGGAGYYRFPTIFWLNSSNTALFWVCIVGMICAVLLLIGIVPGPAALGSWFLYLSLTTAGQVFLGFQWDNLLLETGLLAIFFAPWQVKPSWQKPGTPFFIFVLIFLLRWLLFRLMFTSGAVKLLSNDPTWRNLTALSYHFETQPLPTWIAWYFHQFPEWLHMGLTAVTFFSELIIPFFYFAPRKLRFAAGFLTILFQFGILLTGNYTFFNWLTILLCVPLFDDRFWRRISSRKSVRSATVINSQSSTLVNGFTQLLTGSVVVLIMLISTGQIIALFTGSAALPQPAMAIMDWARPFRSINRYGLFAVMTTERPEIIIEGSLDGENWEAYEFKWKPGDLSRRPRFVAPHQPRLDWQMWFAALGNIQNNPWLANFLLRLLQGSPDVTGLLAHNPFPEAPPQYVRALVYDYQFTDGNGPQTNNWWRRERQGAYTPVLSLPDHGTR